MSSISQEPPTPVVEPKTSLISSIQLPNILALILGLADGVLEYLNQASFDLGPTWTPLVAFGLLFIGAFGVSPLVGSAFRNALHLPPIVCTALTGIATVGAAYVTTASLNLHTKGIIEGVIGLLVWTGFGSVSVVTNQIKTLK